MKIIDDRDVVKQRGKLFLQSLTPGDEMFILGTNKYGKILADFLNEMGIAPKGFINDFIKEEEYEGYPVVTSKLDYSKKKIINSIVEGRVMDGERLIDTLKPQMRSNYFELQRATSSLVEVEFMQNTHSIEASIDEYTKVYDLLSDKLSKDHYENITQFRFNRDIKYLKDFEFNIKGQYFENFIDFSKIESFVDGGSFDGQTALEFVRRNENFKRVFVFEPNAASFDVVNEKLKGYDAIVLFNKGLWSKTEVLKFNANLGSASRIEDGGMHQIDVVALDEVIDGKVDFIKLDIEGAEIEALAGAKRIIQTNTPHLAVCVYHDQIDYVRIAQYVLELMPSYRVYFRHYTQGVFESVMYFVPQ